jgi:hypothetical protein
MEEQQIEGSATTLETVKPERMLNAVNILELANKGYFILYMLGKLPKKEPNC